MTLRIRDRSASVAGRFRGSFSVVAPFGALATVTLESLSSLSDEVSMRGCYQNQGGVLPRSDLCRMLDDSQDAPDPAPERALGELLSGS